MTLHLFMKLIYRKIQCKYLKIVLFNNQNNSVSILYLDGLEYDLNKYISLCLNN